MESLHRAISILGSQTLLAAALGVVQSAVAGWLKRGKVPEEHCPAIEFATAGAVTVEDLAPGRWWVRIPDPGWPHSGGRPMLDYSRQLDSVAGLPLESTAVARTVDELAESHPIQAPPTAVYAVGAINSEAMA